METKDGEIDYSKYSLSELRDVEAHIDARRNPKNYANLMSTIDERVIEHESNAKKEPLRVSGKSPDQVKLEYGGILQKQKIASIIAIALWVPNLIAGYTKTNSFLGIQKSNWFLVSGIGVLVLLWFVIFVFKCPECAKSPGGGWTRRKCKSCGTSLRD